MKRIFIFLLASTLLFPTCACYANTNDKTEASTKPNTPSKEEILSGSILDDIFNDMKENLKNGEEVSISESLEKHGGLYISAQPEYDVSSSSIDWNNLDTSLTNLGFSSLSASLADSQSSIDLSGKANSCTEVFNATFGDIANNLTLEKMEIPEDFKADVMLEQCQNQIMKEYEDALQSSELSDIKAQVEVKSLFEQAEAGPTKYEQKQIDELLEAAGVDYDRGELLSRYYDTVRNNKGLEELPSYEELKAGLSTTGILLNRNNLITGLLKDTTPNVRDENTTLDSNASDKPSDLDDLIQEADKLDLDAYGLEDPRDILNAKTASKYEAQTNAMQEAAKIDPTLTGQAQYAQAAEALFNIGVWVSDLFKSE